MLQIEITGSQNFAGWEAGYWNPRVKQGHAVLLAGADCEKLNVIFDRASGGNKARYLFILDAGFLTVQTQVNLLDNGKLKVRTSLLRIDSFFTETVQGHPVPRAKTTTVYAAQAMFDDKDAAIKSFAALDLRPEHKEFLTLALEKAMLGREEQKLFWGIPRKRLDN